MPEPADELLRGRAARAHLLRRAGFGPDAASLDRASETSYEALVDTLLAGLDTPCPADPAGFDPYVPGSIQQAWLERMVGGVHPLAEKLALFWHGHFATSNAKIEDPALMWQQYRLFRERGGRRFRDLVLGVSRDVAMIRWLDGNANRVGHPNENYARELQELFALGIGNYTEDDVREVARAFTGWGSRHHTFVFRARFHDDGEKTIHGRTGRFGGEEVVDILADHPACAPFVAGKLIRFFAKPDPSATEIEALATTFRETEGDLAATLRALFLSETFRGRASFRALVKGPVELCVGALRAAEVAAVPPWIHGALDRMGQILFRPPSVKGWPAGTGWLSSGAVVERLRVAQRIAAEAPEAVEATILETAFQGDVPPPLAGALEDAEGRRRITLVLACPEFQLA